MALKFSFLDCEYVPEGRIVTIRSPQTLHNDLDFHAVTIVRLADGEEVSGIGFRVDGHDFQISTARLRSGQYQILVRSLVDMNEKQINVKPVSQTLRIQNICGTIPDEIRILRVLHLAVGELGTTRLRPEEEPPEGTHHVDVIKGLNLRTNVVETIARDAEGNEVNYGEILARIEKRRLTKFGRVGEKLWHRMQEAGEEEEIAVAIWPKLDHDHCGYDKFAKRPSMDSGDSVHLTSFQRPKTSVMTTIKDLGVTFDHHPKFPYVTTQLTCSQIEAVAKLEDVRTIVSHHFSTTSANQSVTLPTDIMSPREMPGLYETMTISRCIEAHDRGNGPQGRGVKVAVWEYGQWATTEAPRNNPWKSKWREFEDAAGAPAEDPPDRPHFCLTSAIIQNNHPEPDKHYHGFAPECEQYLANFLRRIWPPIAQRKLELDPEKSFLWAMITNRCTVINASFRLNPGQASAADITHVENMIDWAATTDPYPLVVSVSGNTEGDPSLEVSHRFYNGLIVGAHEPDGKTMWNGSLFGNPQPQNREHDRELPDITAHGGMGMRILMTKNEYQGTSLAAPAVSGTAALLQGMSDELMHSPETVRAIIYASAGRRVGYVDVEGPGWWDEIRRGTAQGPKWPDLKDGAGILDTNSAVKIARNQVDITQTSSVPSRQGGWYRGTILRTYIGQERRRSPYQVVVKTPAGNDHLIAKAAIAWNSRTTGSYDIDAILLAGSYTSVLQKRYDLAVYTAGTDEFVAASSSFDNNYEIVQWKAEPNVEYRILVLFQADDSTSPSSSVQDWYGIAWQFFDAGVSYP